MEHAHSDDLVLVCVHVAKGEALPAGMEGDPEASVMCEECASIDWGAVDWAKVQEITEKANHSKKAFKDAPKELDRLVLACKPCTLEAIAKKWLAKPSEPGEAVTSIGPCRHCGKPILVKSGLASGIRNLVASNQGYNFDLEFDERFLQITIKKRGSSRVTEPTN